MGARMRFATEAETLRAQVARLRQAKGPLFLTMEAGALTRWASAVVRPLVERLIICEPRHNRLINSNPTKSDEVDVEGMCLLLRLGKLKEVWMGTDRTREKRPILPCLTNHHRAAAPKRRSTLKPQSVKMSGAAGQAELYTFSLIKNLHRMVRRFDRVGAHIRSQFFSKRAMSSSTRE